MMNCKKITGMILYFLLCTLIGCGQEKEQIAQDPEQEVSTAITHEVTPVTESKEGMATTLMSSMTSTPSIIPELTVTPTLTQEPTAMPELTGTPTPEKLQQAQEILDDLQAGTVVELPQSVILVSDINGDGVEDTVSWHWQSDDYVFSVNEEEYRFYLRTWSEYPPEGFVHTVNAFLTSPKSMIFYIEMDEYSNGNPCVTIFYYYNGDKLEEIKEFEGEILQFDYVTQEGCYSKYVNGFTTWSLAGFLDQRYGQKKYRIVDYMSENYGVMQKRIAEIPFSFWYCASAILLQDLPVYENVGDTEISTIIPKDAVITWSGMEGLGWLWVEKSGSSSTKGWVKMNGNNIYIGDEAILWHELLKSYIIGAN